MQQRKKLHILDAVQQGVGILDGQFQILCGYEFHIGRPFHLSLQVLPFLIELRPIVCMQALDGVLIHAEFSEFSFFCFFPFEPLFFGSGFVVSHNVYLQSEFF